MARKNGLRAGEVRRSALFTLPMALLAVLLVALPLMTSAQGILPAMAVYAGGILVAWVSGFIFTTLFGCRNVNLD